MFGGLYNSLTLGQIGAVDKVSCSQQHPKLELKMDKTLENWAFVANRKFENDVFVKTNPCRLILKTLQRVCQQLQVGLKPDQATPQAPQRQETAAEGL